MQEAGTSPVTLAQMMGHSSTGIVQTYAKVLDEYRREAVKKLDAHRQLNDLKQEEAVAGQSRLN